MGKVLMFSCFLLTALLFFLPSKPQPVIVPVTTPFRLLSAPVYHEPSYYPIRQQRLLLQLSSTHLHVSYNAEIDLDTCLLHASQWLGLSRLSVITEGFEKDFLVGDGAWIDKGEPAVAIRRLVGLKGEPRLRVLMLLASYYAFQPRAWTSSRDSVMHYLEVARAECGLLGKPAWERQLLCLLGKLYVGGDEVQRGNAFFDECVSLCRKAGDRATEAKAWAWRGLYTKYSPGTTADRIASLQKARDLYREMGDREGEANVLTNTGYLYVSEVELTRGEAAFKESLVLEDSAGFPYTHYTTDDISMVGVFEGKYGEPLEYALQSVKTAEMLRDSVQWGNFYYRLTTLYSFLNNKTADCAKWARRAFDRFVMERENGFLYATMGYMVSESVRTDSARAFLQWVRSIAARYPPRSVTSRSTYETLLTNCYMAMKLYDSAEAHVLELGRLRVDLTKLHGSIENPFADYKMGEVYFLKGDYAKAKMYLGRYVFGTSPGVNAQMKLIAQDELATIDSIQGDYFSSIRNLRNYIHLQDSDFDVQGQRQSEELAVKYETERKEAEIQLRDQRIAMLQQADLLRQSRLRQAELVQRMTIGGIVVLLLIAVLLVRQNRQRKKMSAALERLVGEKDWLLKEVNHRVKNNLHTVISLLESQARNLKNEALDAVQSSQHRIYAMSLIHQKIYQSENTGAIEMAGYLREFIQYLRDSNGNPENIRFYLDIASFRLGLAQAVPLALILNEAVTNSIKHAFPGGREGEIKIRCRMEGQHVVLSVADNGVGMEALSGRTESLGMELMKGLVNELRGRIDLISDNGVTVRVSFDAKQMIRVRPVEENEEGI